MKKIYLNLVEILKSKAKVYSGHTLNFMYLDLSENKRVIFNLDSGELSVLIKDVMTNKGDLTVLFYDSDTVNDELTFEYFEEILNEIENYE